MYDKKFNTLLDYVFAEEGGFSNHKNDRGGRTNFGIAQISLDEYTRKRVLWASKEQSTSASTEFIKVIMKKFPFKIECIQTDNGFEFTNRLNNIF